MPETVWVATLETTTGAGWTSVHHTREAAEAILEAKVEAWNLGHLESRHVLSYSVCQYPVE
jgi:hypothetical protein